MRCDALQERLGIGRILPRKCEAPVLQQRLRLLPPWPLLRTPSPDLVGQRIAQRKDGLRHQVLEGRALVLYASRQHADVTTRAEASGDMSWSARRASSHAHKHTHARGGERSCDLHVLKQQGLCDIIQPSCHPAPEHLSLAPVSSSLPSAPLGSRSLPSQICDFTCAPTSNCCMRSVWADLGGLPSFLTFSRDPPRHGAIPDSSFDSICSFRAHTNPRIAAVRLLPLMICAPSCRRNENLCPHSVGHVPRPRPQVTSPGHVPTITFPQSRPTSF